MSLNKAQLNKDTEKAKRKPSTRKDSLLNLLTTLPQAVNVGVMPPTFDIGGEPQAQDYAAADNAFLESEAMLAPWAPQETTTIKDPNYPGEFLSTPGGPGQPATLSEELFKTPNPQLYTPQSNSGARYRGPSYTPQETNCDPCPNDVLGRREVRQLNKLRAEMGCPPCSDEEITTRKEDRQASRQERKEERGTREGAWSMPGGSGAGRDFLSGIGKGIGSMFKPRINVPMFEEGGEAHMDMDDETIRFYRNKGYNIEVLEDETPKFPEGGEFDYEQYGWQYKKEGDKYLTRESGNTDWIDASNQPGALQAIQTQVYKEQTADQNNHPATVTTNTNQRRKPTGPSVTKLQQELKNEGYYIGDWGNNNDGIDGVLGNDTTKAKEARDRGISADDFNTTAKRTRLTNNPNIAVPTVVVNNARGVEQNPAPIMSIDAETSQQENEENDDTWSRITNLGNTITSGITDQINTIRAQEKAPDPQVYGQTSESGPYQHTLQIDLDDTVYQHVDDFIIEPYLNSNGDKERRTEGWSSTPYTIYGDYDLESQVASYDQGNCLAGALDCNAAMIAPLVDANSIRGLSYKMKDDAGHSIRADKSVYSVPSREKSGLPYEHNKSYDSWELGDALVGEGLAQDMWKSTPGEHGATKVPADLMKIIKGGKIPLGAIIFQHSATDADGGGSYNKYVDESKWGKRSNHTSTVIGFSPEGWPLMYDNGSIREIDEAGLSISRVVIPEGYDNYTFGNLKKGQKQRYQALGYDEDPSKVKYEKKEGEKSYVNEIKKGIHDKAYVIASDYDVQKSTIDKLTNRLVGLSAQETNFSNQGDEDVSWLRAQAIENESGLLSSLKTPAKWIADAFNVEHEGGMPDYKVEMKVWEMLEEKGINPLTKIKEDNEDSKHFGKDRTQAAYWYDRLRVEIPEVDIDRSRSTTDELGYESSVGPLAIKYLPKYVTTKFGIEKGDLYGATVSENKEFENGGVAALVHLVESYKKYGKRYPDLSEEQLIDVATIAYNNKGKVMDKDFIDFYIRKEKAGDNYLNKIKGFAEKYNG